MRTTIKEMNHEQLRELATGIKSDYVYYALNFLFFLCGPTIQTEIKKTLTISSEGALEIDEVDPDDWDDRIAKGQRDLQFLIGKMPQEELCTGYRYLEYIVSNE